MTEAYVALARLVGGPPTPLDLAACLEEHCDAESGAWIHTSAAALGIRGCVSLAESMVPPLAARIEGLRGGRDESAGWDDAERTLAGLLAAMLTDE